MQGERLLKVNETMKSQYSTAVRDEKARQPLTRRDFLASSMALMAGVAAVPAAAQALVVLAWQSE